MYEKFDTITTHVYLILFRVALQCPNIAKFETVNLMLHIVHVSTCSCRWRGNGGSHPSRPHLSSASIASANPTSHRLQFHPAKKNGTFRRMGLAPEGLRKGLAPMPCLRLAHRHHPEVRLRTISFSTVLLSPSRAFNHTGISLPSCRALKSSNPHRSSPFLFFVRYGLDCCRRCFRENATAIGFHKYR